MGKKSKLDLVPIEENGQSSAPALDLVPLDEEPVKKKDDTSVGPNSESGSTTAPSSAGGLDLQEPVEPSEEPTKERNPAVTLAKTLYSTARYQMPADLIGGTMAMEKMPFDLNEKVFKPMFSWLDSGRPEVKAKLEESTRRKTMLRQAMQLKAGGQEFTKDLVNSLDKADDFVDYLNWAGSAVGQAAGQIPAAILTRGGTAFGQEIGTIYLEGVRKIAEEKKITPEEVIKTGQDDALYPMVFGYAAGSLEMLGAKGVAESFSKKDVMGSLAQRGMAFFKKAGKAGAKESLTEGGQSFIEQVGSSKAADRTWSDTFSSIDPNDIKESMAQGFVGGKALSMVGQAVEKTAKPKAPQTVVQEEKAQVASTSDVQAAERAAEVIQEKVNQSTNETERSTVSQPSTTKLPDVTLTPDTRTAQSNEGGNTETGVSNEKSIDNNSNTSASIIPPDLQERGEQVPTTLVAKTLFGNGARIFAFPEQDAEPVELTSVQQMDKYTADQLMAYKPEEAKPKVAVDFSPKSTFYHASQRKRSGRLTPSTAQGLGEGIYFATDKEGTSQEFGDEITEANLQVTNPVETGTKEWWPVQKLALRKSEEADPKNKGLKPGDEDYREHDYYEINSKFISDAAKELGFDAIVNKNDQYGHEILVLDESKISYKEIPSETKTNKSEGVGITKPTKQDIEKVEKPEIERWLEDEYGDDYISFEWDGDVLEIFQSRDQAPIEIGREELLEKGVIGVTKTPVTKPVTGVAFHGVTSGNTKGAIYLGDKSLADDYGDGETKQFEYTLQKPFTVEKDSDFDAIQKIIDDYYKVNPKASWHPQVTEHVNSELKKQGYDGLIIKDKALESEKGYEQIGGTYGEPQVVVFDRKNVTEKPTNTKKVFVYGTLTDPKVRKKAMGDEIDATETTMQGVTKVDGDFSTLETGKGETKGQMIEVTPEQLEKLDKWESKYDRKEIKPGVFAYVRKPNVTAKGKEVDNEAIKLAKEYDEEARNPKVPEKERAIAAVIKKVQLGKYGDPNSVSQSMAKSYMSKTGTPIDVVAQNASKEGLEVTPDDVWDFMVKYPNGAGTMTQPAGNPRLKAINDKYQAITGKSLNRKTARDMATSLRETLGEERANAESAKFFDKTTDEFSLDALIENMEADPEGYMALHKIGQEEFDHQLNAAHNERAKQGPSDQVYGEDGGTAGQGQGTQSQGGPLSERFGDTSQDTEATVQEIASIPLTHVPGLNMGKGLSAGTYLSTEEQNRYGDKPQSATVTVKKPFRFKSENDIIPFRNEVLNKNINKFEAKDFADGNDFRREATLEDLSDTGIDKLADLVRKELINEGYDSIYLPATETQEGELIVFDKENVKIGEREAVKATDSDALIHYGNVGDQRGEVGDTLEVLEEIPISKLSLDEFADINYDNVEKYSKLETEIPPIEVHRDGKENQVYDGNHRVLAAKKKGQKKIKAWVSTVGKDGTFILVKPQKASTPQTTAKANTKTEEQAKTPSKGTYQLQAEQGVAKAEAAVKRAQEVYDEKKAKLGKSLKEDQIDIFGKRTGDEGKLFQEGAGDTQAAKRQLDELKQNIDEAKRDLEDAKAEVAKAKELDKNNLFAEEATTEEPLPGKPTVSGIEFIDDSKALEKKIEETVEDEDGNTATREITLARKQADVKKRLAKLNGLMDCIYG